MKGTDHDPKGLIHEAYRIDGITAGECRSIFLDWALSLPAGTNAADWAARLLVDHAHQPKDHPMTLTLIAALEDGAPPRRRGGRAARIAD